MPSTKLYTLREAAEYLGLDASTLRRQAELGRLGAHKIGRDWTTTERQVRAYERDHRRG